MIGLGQSSSLGIGLAVTLIDNFSNSARRVSGAMLNMTQARRRVIQSQNAAASAMSAAGTTMLESLRPVAASFIGAITQASEFQYVMSGVKVATEATDAEFKALNKTVLDLGNDSIFSAKQVADAAYELATAGYTAKQTENALAGIVALGAAADVPLEKAALLAANIRNAFQIPASETMRIADILSTAAIKSSAKLPEIASGIKYVAARAAYLNVPLEETISLLATLNSMGLHGSTAGTAADNLLRTISTAMSDFATKKQSKIMDLIGLTPQDMVDAKGELIELPKLIDKIFSKLRGYSRTQQSAVISGLINERGARAALLSAISGSKGEGLSLAELTRILKEESIGSADKVAKERQNNLYGDIERAKSAWETMMITIGESSSTVVRPLVQAFTKLLEVTTDILTSPLGKWIIGVGTAWLVAKLAAAAFMLVASNIVLMSNMGIIRHQAWATSAVAAYGRAAVAARTYAAQQALALGAGSRRAGPVGLMAWFGASPIIVLLRGFFVKALGFMSFIPKIVGGLIAFLGPVLGPLALLAGILAILAGTYAYMKSRDNANSKEKTFLKEYNSLITQQGQTMAALRESFENGGIIVNGTKHSSGRGWKIGEIPKDSEAYKAVGGYVADVIEHQKAQQRELIKKHYGEDVYQEKEVKDSKGNLLFKQPALYTTILLDGKPLYQGVAEIYEEELKKYGFH